MRWMKSISDEHIKNSHLHESRCESNATRWSVTTRNLCGFCCCCLEWIITIMMIMKMMMTDKEAEVFIFFGGGTYVFDAKIEEVHEFWNFRVWQTEGIDSSVYTTEQKWEKKNIVNAHDDMWTQQSFICFLNTTIFLFLALSLSWFLRNPKNWIMHDIHEHIGYFLLHWSLPL